MNLLDAAHQCQTMLSAINMVLFEPKDIVVFKKKDLCMPGSVLYIYGKRRKYLSMVNGDRWLTEFEISKVNHHLFRYFHGRQRHEAFELFDYVQGLKC